MQDSNTDPILASLKACQGERHARDHANNPQLASNEAVPKNSAAAKNDSAMGHYIAGVAIENHTAVPNPIQSVHDVAGRPLPLDAEPVLVEMIQEKAETASNPVAADHFAKAADGLRGAYEQDKAWLARHPEINQHSRQ
eukprot:TRINITY_DN3545_c1_g1_i2.p1 TRINITY_DN3545_c1_g1~~TRINITY_DN3545_c1_g1_i2.p1  ORF type:complete len:139 (-),score=40.75 TRINITY_DN3545_c1_g1_i2:106-522(-)